MQENLQWACVRLAELSAILLSSAVPDAAVQFRLPHSRLEPSVAKHLHAVADAFHAAEPTGDRGHLRSLVAAVAAPPQIVLTCEQERTLLATCTRALSELAAHEGRRGWGETIASVAALISRKPPAAWKRRLSAHVQAVCRERTWLLLQAEREPTVLRAVLWQAGTSVAGRGHDHHAGSSARERASTGDRRVVRWQQALEAERLMRDALEGHALGVPCPVLGVRYHGRGKVRPVHVPGCGCVMSWLAGSLAVRDGTCLRCGKAVSSGGLLDADMPAAPHQGGDPAAKLVHTLELTQRLAVLRGQSRKGRRAVQLGASPVLCSSAADTDEMASSTVRAKLMLPSVCPPTNPNCGASSSLNCS